MTAHVVCRDLVRDSLKAEIVHQPVEQNGAVMPFNRGTESPVTEFFEQLERTGETADLMDQVNGVMNGASQYGCGGALISLHPIHWFDSIAGARSSCSDRSTLP